MVCFSLALPVSCRRPKSCLTERCPPMNSNQLTSDFDRWAICRHSTSSPPTLRNPRYARHYRIVKKATSTWLIWFFFSFKGLGFSSYACLCCVLLPCFPKIATFLCCSTSRNLILCALRRPSRYTALTLYEKMRSSVKPVRQTVEKTEDFVATGATLQLRDARAELLNASSISFLADLV